MTDRFNPALFTVDTVSRLVASQFPHWADLPVREVSLQGWDNRTFRLGDELSVRLPSAAGYVPQIGKEHRWLPRLAPCLPLPIPVPLAKGQPAEGYPSEWSVYRWLPGEPAATACIPDLTRFATDLAQFLSALYRIDPGDGPPAGPHSFYRGGQLSTYDAETRPLDRNTPADEIDARSGHCHLGGRHSPRRWHGTARLGPRRRRRSQPAGSGWPSQRRDRLRLLGRRRSRLRHRSSPGRTCPARAGKRSAASSRWTPAPGSAAAAGPSGKPSSSSRATAKPIRPRPTKPAASSPKSSARRCEP